MIGAPGWCCIERGEGQLLRTCSGCRAPLLRFIQVAFPYFLLLLSLVTAHHPPLPQTVHTFSAWCSTALILSTISPWPSSSRGWPQAVPGPASMSSTESTWRWVWEGVCGGGGGHKLGGWVDGGGGRGILGAAKGLGGIVVRQVRQCTRLPPTEMVCGQQGMNLLKQSPLLSPLPSLTLPSLLLPHRCCQWWRSKCWISSAPSRPSCAGLSLRAPRCSSSGRHGERRSVARVDIHRGPSPPPLMLRPPSPP